MENIEGEQIYKIDRKRLYNYYERIKNQYSYIPTTELVAKFLNSQSIGEDVDNVLSILRYFESKITKGKEILDLAFEWIRAHKIRLEYKKYLIRAQYPHDDLNLAIDDCIYNFFLEYDNYLRKLLKKEIYEHELSALFEIFFRPYESRIPNIDDTLKKYRNKVPTIFRNNKRVNTNIITLRSGLSNIIIKDYKRVLKSREEEKKLKEKKLTKSFVSKKEEIREFNGTHLERLIKTYCFSKKKIAPRDIESAVTNFLTSCFKFGNFYKYEEFSDILINSLTEYIRLGLTEKIKNSYSLDFLKRLISRELRIVRTLHQIKILDGVAWINDLKPVLKKFVENFLNTLLIPEKTKIYQEPIKEKIKREMLEDKELSEEIDLSTIFDLNLDVETYRNKLEELLENSKISMIKKRDIIRRKVQEFIDQKRK